MRSGEGLFPNRLTLQSSKALVFGAAHRPKFMKKRSSASSPILPSHGSSAATSFTTSYRCDSSPAPQRKQSSGGQGEEENDKGKGFPMWHGVPARSKLESSEGHKPIFRLVEPLLLSRVFSGQGPKGRRCTVWPDREYMQLDAMMRECWTEIRSQRIKRFGLTEGLHVDKTPTDVEAKKMFEAISAMRSHIMEKIRGPGRVALLLW